MPNLFNFFSGTASPPTKDRQDTGVGPARAAQIDPYTLAIQLSFDSIVWKQGSPNLDPKSLT
ncbi:hypothetical protein FRX31_007492 [Thalictrum thalictroides]|uniref:Uncharacterized protein n=1 Tax=Thalictrum thalictroides TaxID=46969 RepID=A0A7J6W7Z5_THATH|nr:hypothetical protein FRX31_017355 [Thalictrum thalictroides]KAF5202920.1 hypothetical protein FRX31_007492 [Thalictrum thalictroides]